MQIDRKSSELVLESIKNNVNTFCSGLFLSARWFVLSQCGSGRLNFIILPDRDSAEYCSSDLYNLVKGDSVFFLPDSAGRNLKSTFKATASVQRTSAISEIKSYKAGNSLYIVTYPDAVSDSLPAAESKLESFLTFRKNEEMRFTEAVGILAERGFEKVDIVSQPGQFAVRGGIIDVFSYSYNYPYRISFFGDEIDRINVFDANTQLSSVETASAEIYGDLSSFGEQENPETTCNILDILSKDSVIWMDSADTYKDADFMGGTESFRRVFIDTPLFLKKTESETIRFNISVQPVFNKNFELLESDIKRKYSSGYKVYIYSGKLSQIERIKSIITEDGGIVPEFKEGKDIHQGFIDNVDKICCYSDHEIFDRFHRATLRRTVDRTEQLAVNDLSAFSIGDYIVHIDLGIGVFGGLVRLKDDKGKYHEVVKLQYKGGDVVFISVHSLHKISKYRSKDGEEPRINKLGSKTWQNLKSSAKSKVKDMARELIQLYAKRKASGGYAFSPDSTLQHELESSFEWEDTPDQEKATEAIKMDMEDSCPMDRLICGDVGFGKTELAVRAAFKAVSDGKQVAVLVPTTILCLQHFNTFSKRLKEFPCVVDYVSRLRTAKEIKNIQEDLRKGRIDIIIGTHKLLGDSFVFKDMGLLIIDEEQKFGVGAKEKLRKLESSVDTLTLTATPIPRTLQFSLLGARDLSIINTPPPNRVPVQTEIILFDKNEIKSIINYELKRGGQIFFVHNRVEELENIRDILHRLVPDMSICVAHGQMESKVLEDKILDFMAGIYDMLLCTTIIENGLDIPNANTIIINQAQNIGLSDLHQLRGRVGRSKVKGFCYLIVPPLVSITEDARKRLRAIETFSDLGSGFNIAMQDLDIRGAGNLIGAQQSGFISDMGIETYQKILEEAMEELGFDDINGKQSRTDEVSITECTIDTDIDAMIPESYINMTVEKIRIYKELDNASDDRHLMKMHAAMEDRFGPVPPETEALFDIVRIRSLGRKLGFEKIIIKNGIMICFFISNPMNPYYKGKKFARIIERLNECQGIFEMKQKDDKLRLVAHNVSTSSEAFDCLSRLK